jgi:hypothetical protein
MGTFFRYKVRSPRICEHHHMKKPWMGVEGILFFLFKDDRERKKVAIWQFSRSITIFIIFLLFFYYFFIIFLLFFYYFFIIFLLFFYYFFIIFLLIDFIVSLSESDNTD